jgi:hypothetical protein
MDNTEQFKTKSPAPVKKSPAPVKKSTSVWADLWRLFKYIVIIIFGVVIVRGALNLYNPMIFNPNYQSSGSSFISSYI